VQGVINANLDFLKNCKVVSSTTGENQEQKVLSDEEEEERFPVTSNNRLNTPTLKRLAIVNDGSE
jgi:hypothetical protein